VNKLLLIILCGISFSTQATVPPLSDSYELNSIIKYAETNDLDENQLKIKLDACSKKGNKYCSETLGIRYFREKNYDKAIGYFQKADCKFKTQIGEDYWPSSLYLGVMYLKGFGIEKNLQKSIGYFKQCVSTGEEHCAFMLAGVYNELWFKNHDPVPAIAWMKVAEKMGMLEVPGPKNATASMKESIEFMQESLTPEEIEKANKQTITLCNNIPKCSKYKHQ
jgi:TPR repeat protein